MDKSHYVCLVCGYNMVGYYPERCPFCGAVRKNFITAGECSDRYRIIEAPVTDQVTRLNSHPSLGLEHAAYRIETGAKKVMVDCPSSFDPNLAPVDTITFTHHHFLGASNLYRSHVKAEVSIHRRDSENVLTRGFIFDRVFHRAFDADGLEAYPIDGHTAGFTFYLYGEVLFVCDYVFVRGDQVRRFNPFGPREDTLRGALRMREILVGREIGQVCGYNYVMDYEPWLRGVERLLG